MPVLGSATLELNADSARLEADLGRTVAMATAWGTTIGTVVGQGIISATRAIGGLVERSIAAADAADKITQKFGLSTEWFAQTAAAAQLADVEVGKFTSSLRTLASAAQKDSGPAAEAFRAMGIEAEKFAGDTQKLFDAVMAKLATYRDDINKTRLATAIFGASGADLIPLANELEKNRRLASELGLTLSKETTAAAAGFKDNMKAAELATGALGTTIAAALLPTMEKFSGFLVESAKNGDRMQKTALLLELSLKTLATSGAVVVGVFSTVGRLTVDVATAMIEAAKGNYMLAFRMLQEGGASLRENLTDNIEAVANVWTDTAAKVSAGAAEKGEQLAAPALEAAKKVEKAKDTFRDFASAVMRAYDDAANAALADQEIERRAEEDQRAAIMRVHEEAMAAAQADAEIERQAAEAAKVRVRAVTDETKKADDVGRRFGMTFSSAFEKAMTSGARLGDVVRGLTQDVLQLVIRLSVTEPLARSVQGAFSGMNFGSLWGGGASAQPDFSAGYYAAGGRPPVGMPAIVGERGPELFIPDTAGTVVPNHRLGGVTINSTVNVSGGGVTEAQVRYAVAMERRGILAQIQERSER